VAKHSFPKAARLCRRREFLRVQRTGLRTHTPSFVVVCRSGTAKQARLGVTVSTKVGNAVTRNRIKRRVREIFRTRRTQLPPGLDLVVIAKRGANDLSFHEIEQELLAAFDR
jgi:ribonuclease P protein component